MWIVCLQLPKLPSVLRLYATWLALSLLCLALVFLPLPPPGPRLTFLRLLLETNASSSPSVDPVYGHEAVIVACRYQDFPTAA